MKRGTAHLQTCSLWEWEFLTPCGWGACRFGRKTHFWDGRRLDEDFRCYGVTTYGLCHYLRTLLVAIELVCSIFFVYPLVRVEGSIGEEKTERQQSCAANGDKGKEPGGERREVRMRHRQTDIDFIDGCLSLLAMSSRAWFSIWSAGFPHRRFRSLFSGRKD